MFKLISRLLRDYPGKALGLLRVPIDLALINAGLPSAEQSVNPWVFLVGLAGLLSSIVLLVYADRSKPQDQNDPQDLTHRFKSLMFWSYPWEFASTMAFVKVINFLISGISRARFDDFFLGLCILIGQSIVQIPERSNSGEGGMAANTWVKFKNAIAASPNRAGAYVMTIGNLVFAGYALSPFNASRLFAGVWNIVLNTYLMARSSKRLRQSVE